MKLNYSLVYVLYIGLAVMLSPLKLNYTVQAPQLEKKRMAERETAYRAKAEVLHSELLFKY